MSKNTKLSNSMKGNKNAVGNKGGCPTDYKVEYNELAYNYCLLGATDKKLANFFDVVEKTINNWKKEHPKFLQSIRAGKEIADMDVAKSFFNNAKGFVAVSRKPIKIRVWDSEAKRLVEKIEMTTETTQHAPNTEAGKFWLKNRQPEMWKEKSEVSTSYENEKPLEIEIIQRPKDDANKTS